MPFDPQNITKDHILRAVQLIKDKGITLQKSTKFSVMIDDVLYPPKEVMRYAHEQMNGERIWERSGGEPTNKYLVNLGFDVTKSTVDPIITLIDRYKYQLKTDRLKDELYKWKLLKAFGGRPNLEAENLYDELVSIDFNNLLYYNSIRVMKFLSAGKTKEYKACLDLLFNEMTPLQDRITQFEKTIAFTYNKMFPDEKVSHHHDERTISTLLTYKYPDKYTFYKASFYQKYCKLIGVTPKKKNEKYVHYLILIRDLINHYIKEDHELIQLVDSIIKNEECFKDEKHLILAQDILYTQLDGLDNVESLEDIEDNNLTVKDMNHPLNQILFGPPGTGKTYNTINKALEIIGEDVQAKSRKYLKAKFEEKMAEGQIVFTTFHQSMSYEDFIEGIKPLKPEDGDVNVKYDVVPGIFKSLCEKAKSIHVNNKIDWDSPRYYKMSLGGKLRSDIHDWCIENSVIALGWGGHDDLSSLSKISNWTEYRNKYIELFPDVVDESRFHIQATYAFLNMKENDIVVISKGNHVIDAIGVVKGPYYWDDNSPSEYCHFRKVEWVVKNLNTIPDRFLKKQISQMSIYEFFDQDIKKDAFKEITASGTDAIAKPHVLIIDEINRGNVSQIFGELITLIEEDKRLGKDEALEVTLPYSKEKFGVPANLYIIGTMNTADRSVEALDTALRRRFSFEEMPPKPELLAPNYRFWDLLWQYEGIAWNSKEYKPKEKMLLDFLGASKNIWDTKKEIWESFSSQPKNESQVALFSVEEFSGINLELVLRKLNKRIELLLDKDHQIGHSYFINVLSMADLKSAFQNKIIPLLQEYFFGDYSKIGLVLGTGFIEQQDSKEEIFAKFYDENASDYSERKTYILKNILDFSDQELVSAIDTLMK